MTEVEDLELPTGWSASRLGDVVTPINDKIDPKLTPDAHYIGLEHVEAHTMRIIGHGSGSDVTSTKSRFSPGDVLYGKLRPYLNKVAQPDFGGICSTDFLVFADSPQLERSFLANYLNQLWVANRAHELSNGVELPRVDWRSLSQLPIHYPRSKVEQLMMANRINTARLSAASATGHLDAARRAIERMRLAVLVAGASGRLTASWRHDHPSEVSAQPLLANLLRQSRNVPHHKIAQPTNHDPLRHVLPEGWVVASPSQLCTAIVDCPHSTPKYGAGTRFAIDTTCMSSRGIELDKLRIVSEATFRERNRRLEPAAGDVVFAREGTVGTAVVISDSPKLCLGQRVMLLRPAEGISPQYLRLALMSPQTRSQYADQILGTTVAHINVRDVVRFALPLPSTQEQAEIVRRVNELSALADALIQRIDAASQKVQRSSQAVLAKAFRAELQISN